MTNTETVADPAASPCIGVCALEPATGLCEGCLRTGGEIAAWRDASTDVRRAILRRIDERRLSRSAPGASSSAAAATD